MFQNVSLLQTFSFILLCSDGSEVLIIEQWCTDYFTYSYKRRRHDLVNLDNMFKKI
jgi:hypothetical protein